MTPLPIDGLLNALLNEDVLGQDLSAKDKASVRAMVRSLTEDLPDLSTGGPPSEPDEQPSLGFPAAAKPYRSRSFPLLSVAPPSASVILQPGL